LIVIVGSRSLKATPDVALAIANIMLREATDTYGIRGTTQLYVNSEIELAVFQLCLKFSREIQQFTPTGTGRGSVYQRDYQLVEGATRVIAFFPLDHFMEGGTGHVVKAALDRGISVEAYAITDDGSAVLHGGTDDH
jgi:hypothetical protein